MARSSYDYGFIESVDEHLIQAKQLLLLRNIVDKFIPLIDSKTTVIHGELGKLKKYHLYFIVRDGITMYCKTVSPLSITPSIEVEKIDTGGVIKL